MPLEPFVDQNPVFAPIKRADQRYILPYGGSGGGKSIFIAQYLIELCMRDKRENILLARKVFKDVRESNFRAIVKVAKRIGLAPRLDILEQQIKIRFPNGAKMQGVGLQDRRRLKSVEGPSKVHMEESNQFNEEDFTELDRRLRGSHKPDFKIFMTFNPNMPKSHWLRQKFFRTDGEYRDDSFFHKTTYKDNLFLDEEYEKILERLPEKERKIYKYGGFYDVQDPDQLISEELVDEAFERDSTGMYGKRKLGVDAARFGDDRNAIALLDGSVLTDLESFGESRTTETASRVVVLISDKDVDRDYVVVDALGLGAGVADNLHQSGIDVLEFKAGEGQLEDDIYKDRESFFEFKNKRSQAWWYLYRCLKEGMISFDIDPDSEKGQRLREDLTSPKYRIVGDKKFEVEPKSSGQSIRGTGADWGLKERLGRSTDEGDALVQVNFANRLQDKTDYSRVL